MKSNRFGQQTFSWRFVGRVAAHALAGALFFKFLLVFVAGPVQVEGSSMMPTLKSGQLMVVHWTHPRLGVPAVARGDIVLLEAPVQFDHPNTLLVKRVVGLAGDTVAFDQDRLVLNGEPATYRLNAAQEATERSAGLPAHSLTLLDTRHGPALLPQRVPENTVFVAGDNRSASTDSRTFGPVPLDHLRGIVLLRNR